jgi:hypothetical protein
MRSDKEASSFVKSVEEFVGDQQYWIFATNHTRGHSGLSFPRPNLTERLAVLLEILHGEVVDFVPL